MHYLLKSKLEASWNFWNTTSNDSSMLVFRFFLVVVAAILFSFGGKISFMLDAVEWSLVLSFSASVFLSRPEIRIKANMFSPQLTLTARFCVFHGKLPQLQRQINYWQLNEPLLSGTSSKLSSFPSHLGHENLSSSA